MYILFEKGYHGFLLKDFCLTAKNFFKGTLLCFKKLLVSKSIRDKKGGCSDDFPSKMFCLTVSNLLVEEPFGVSESFEFRKVLCLGREYHNFVQKKFCLTTPQNFVEEPFCVSQNFWFRKFLCIREGCFKILCEKVLVSHCQKLPYGNPLVFQLFWVSKNVRDKRGAEIRIFRRIFFPQSTEKNRIGTLNVSPI